jgi:hypothetical protein
MPFTLYKKPLPKPMSREYKKVNDELRMELIKMVSEDKISIRNSSVALGINYENAKAIYRCFRLQKRVTKVKFRKPK